MCTVALGTCTTTTLQTHNTLAPERKKEPRQHLDSQQGSRLTRLMAAAEEAKARCRLHQSAAPLAPSHTSCHSSCLSTAAAMGGGGVGRSSVWSGAQGPSAHSLRALRCALRCNLPAPHLSAACSPAPAPAWAAATPREGRRGRSPLPAHQGRGEAAVHGKVWRAAGQQGRCAEGSGVAWCCPHLELGIKQVDRPHLLRLLLALPLGCQRLLLRLLRRRRSRRCGGGSSQQPLALGPRLLPAGVQLIQGHCTLHPLQATGDRARPVSRHAARLLK